MAPAKKMKTYGKSKQSKVNNSVDAINILFAKNKAKLRRNKKKLVIKELPARPVGQTLLADDSLHISLEDTFDKIAKGNFYNVVTIKPQISLISHSNSDASKSIKQVDSYYSPVMTRRRRKFASLKELSQTASSNAINKSDSIIPRINDLTVDHINSSLEVEKVPKILPTSLSYIKLPEDISNNSLKPNTSRSRKEISYDPIFTNTFREKQKIHSSTPMVPMKSKKNLINYTISPIKNITLPEDPVNMIMKKSVYVPLCTPIPKKSSARMVNTSVESNNSPIKNDWKLQVNPRILLTRCPQSVDKIHSRDVSTSFNISSILPDATGSDRNSRNSFITLRRRKVAKSNTKNYISRSANKKHLSKNLNIEASNASSNTYLTRSLADFDSFFEKASGSKNLTRSLADFDAFVDKMNNTKFSGKSSASEISSRHRQNLPRKSKSFNTQNEDLFSSSQHVNNTQDSKSVIYTPIHFVTKRRRLLSDSCLASSQKQKTPVYKSSNKSKTIRPKRRLSLQEPVSMEYSDIVLKEAVVILSKVDFGQQVRARNSEMTSSIQPETKNVQLCDNQGNNSSCSFNENIGTILSRARDPDIQNHVFKQLFLNLVNLPLDQKPSLNDNETKNEDDSSISDRSKSLFKHSNRNSGNHTINNTASVNVIQPRQIDSINPTEGTYSGLNLSENNEIADIVTKKQSFKRQTPVQDKIGNVISEDTCGHNTIDILCSSNENIGIDVTRTIQENNKALSTRLNIQGHEFEKFFVNMTKRIKYPMPNCDNENKSETNEVQSLDSIQIEPIIENSCATVDEETDRELTVKKISNPRHSSNGIDNQTRRKSRVASTKRSCNACEVENLSEDATKRSRILTDSCKSNCFGSEFQGPRKSDRRVFDTKDNIILSPVKVDRDIFNSAESADNSVDLSTEIIAKETNKIIRNSNINTASTNSHSNEFETISVETMEQSGRSFSKVCDNKSIGVIEDTLQKLDESSAVDARLNVELNIDTNGSLNKFENEKKMIINLMKSPWRKKTSGPLEASQQSILIDLTTSDDGDCHRKSSEEVEATPIKAEQSISDPFQINSSSDIIESSIAESDIIDVDGFAVPSISNFRRRQSKTLLLKAGKLWRRSLSEYKRSSLVLSLINEDACILKDGRYCICPRCKVARQSKCTASRRFSRIVPGTSLVDPQYETTLLESYAHNVSYVSDQILEDNLENNFRSLSLIQRKTSIIQNSAPVTARELVLRRCGQTEPLQFGECYPGSLLQNCQKIGEGVYGEVFLFRNPNGGTSVMKVIPIEGDLIVNGERQKKFDEILSEIVIAMELSNLRNKKQNTTSGFSETQKIQCVQGSYPEKLLDLWDLYDETRGSENDSPEIFGDDQLYIVLQLANGGRDLEAFIFNNSLQAYTMFQQVACALAIAEEELRFEHRDLHWGNILLSTVDKNKKLNFRLGGKNYEIMTKGVEVAIIDFTLSRIECDGVVIFNDLSLDPDLFTAEGDYQFEIYKLMQKKNGNNWERFEPYTNVLWLHYTLDKAITALRYKNVQTKIHKEYIGKLKHLKKDILNYNSVKEFVLSNF